MGNLTEIPDFLAEQRDASPAELQHLFISFEDFWERKLWHQLTDCLIEFFNHPESAPQRLAFYKNFVLTFADKINQLKLVTLALRAATQCKGKVWLREYIAITYIVPEPHERLSFLSAAAKRVDNQSSQDAYVYATVAVATVKLELVDLEGARKELDKAEKILDSFDSVETIVHAAFYQVNADYYQVRIRGGLSAVYVANTSSQNLTLHHTTRTHFCTLRVSISTTLPLLSEEAEPTT
jgi:26S proteasome regulatory subunit N9